MTDVGMQILARVLLSVVFLTGYFMLLGILCYVELFTPDTQGLTVGERSLNTEIDMLIGVLTAGVAQIMHHWFYSKSD